MSRWSFHLRRVLFDQTRRLLAGLLVVVLIAAVPVSDSPSARAQGADEIQVAYAGQQARFTLRMPDGVPPYEHNIDVFPQHGSLGMINEFTLVYTPDTGYTGPDSFTYTLTDSAAPVNNVRTADVAITVLGVGGAAVSEAPEAGVASVPEGDQIVPDEYIAHYAPGTPIEEVRAEVAASGGTILHEIPALNAVLVRLEPRAGTASLEDSPTVTVLEPNRKRYPSVIPGDDYLHEQWAPNTIHAYNAWNTTTGSPEAVIAVLDTGVDLNHQDLNDKLLPGYDFVDNRPNPQDSAGHGTHVAGIAAAESNNDQGVAGVSWLSSILPVRIVGPYGASSVDIADGIIYATDHGAKVINLSLGGPGWVKIERDAVNYAAARGVVVVAAAGNEDWSVPSYPASYDHVISVASMGENNTVSWFSNYGPYVDIAAPGEYIYSTIRNNRYGDMSGTSMASPQVAGVAALVWASGHAVTVDEVFDALLCTAFDIGPDGRDDDVGWGMVQADWAVDYVPGVSCRPHVEHDDFDDARVIGAPYTDTVSTVYATSWDDDPLPCAGDSFHTVWYRFSPGAQSGRLSLDTAGSDYDTVLSVYSGTRSDLRQVACNDDDGALLTSALDISAIRSRTYFIMVSSVYYEGGGGDLVLNADFEPYPPPGCEADPGNPNSVFCTAD
ncbi:MAG: S8 family serine peptidase [Anaerolineae bacterium]|nr:S8 family serine peptidase [Anaerolineae bacterium]